MFPFALKKAFSWPDFLSLQLPLFKTEVEKLGVELGDVGRKKPTQVSSMNILLPAKYKSCLDYVAYLQVLKLMD